MANGAHDTRSSIDPLKSSRDIAIVLPDSSDSIPARSKHTQILSNIPHLQAESLPVFESTKITVQRGQDRKVSLIATDGEAYPLKINRATEISFADGRSTAIVLTQSCTVMSEEKFFVAIAITDSRGNVLLEEAIIDHVDPCFSAEIDLEESLRKLSDEELCILLAGDQRWLVTNAAGESVELNESTPNASITVKGSVCALSLRYLSSARESGTSIKKSILQVNGKEISVLASVRSDTGVTQYTPPFHKPALTFSV